MGGGPTGVELAGAISDLAHTVLVRDFKRIHPENTKILLLESGDGVLKNMGPELSKKAREELESLSVEVRTGKAVTNINGDGVFIGEEFIPSKTVFWAAGVQASPLPFLPEVERDRASRIKVNANLNIDAHPEIFVVGDMAAITDREGKAVPGLAPAAMQTGQHAADAILKSIAGLEVKPFAYTDKGQMATIGKRKAVGIVAGQNISGFVAWLAWLFVHLYYIIGFRNRLLITGEWAWAYVFSKRGARLITNHDWQLKATDTP